MAAQQVVRDELDRLGFGTSVQPIGEDIAADPVAGVPPQSYAGRGNVIGHLAAGTGPSLLLNGHIDVVPAEAPLWSSPPFQPVRRDGWLTGRGAGDMKGGFALGVLALGALNAAAPGWLTGQLTFASVIEEECTGNGTLAAARAGVLADAAVLLEPTDLGLMLGGVGILWAEITVRGLPAHAESAHRAVNPVDAAWRVIDAVRSLEKEMALELDGPFARIDGACAVNVGTFRAGDWPSSVPGQAVLGVRVGFPPGWPPDEALKRVADAVAGAAAADPWLAGHPPQVRAAGFRAEGYLLDGAHPLAAAVSAAHESAHGEPPRPFVMGSTTDARLYINQFGVPALAYGPRTRNIHGPDEAVELDSIVAGARTLARFLAGYYAAGGLPGGSAS
jgi:acetylornithine deacetylase